MAARCHAIRDPLDRIVSRLQSDIVQIDPVAGTGCGTHRAERVFARQRGLDQNRAALSDGHGATLQCFPAGGDCA